MKIENKTDLWLRVETAVGRNRRLKRDTEFNEKKLCLDNEKSYIIKKWQEKVGSHWVADKEAPSGLLYGTDGILFMHQSGHYEDDYEWKEDIITVEGLKQWLKEEECNHGPYWLAPREYKNIEIFDNPSIPCFMSHSEKYDGSIIGDEFGSWSVGSWIEVERVSEQEMTFISDRSTRIISECESITGEKFSIGYTPDDSGGFGFGIKLSAEQKVKQQLEKLLGKNFTERFIYKINEKLCVFSPEWDSNDSIVVKDYYLCKARNENGSLNEMSLRYVKTLSRYTRGRVDDSGNQHIHGGEIVRVQRDEIAQINCRPRLIA